MLRQKAWIIALLVLAVRSASAWQADAKPALEIPSLAPPSETDRQTIRAVIKLITDQHISGHPVDDEIAERAVKLFLEALDGSKWYFTQADVDLFRRRAPQLDDQLIAGDFTLTLEIFNLFRKRLTDRLTAIDQLLAAPHNFAQDERTAVTGSAYFKDETESQEAWRKRVKYELLVHKSAGADDEEARRRAARNFADTLQNIRQLTTSDVVAFQADALAKAFDPQSTFIAPQKQAEYAVSLSGQLVGVGLSLQVRSGYVTVVAVIPNGPAAKDGHLKAGDRLLAVATGADGPFVDLVGLRLSEAVSKLRGERGSTARIRYLSPGEFEASVCTLIRDTVAIDNLSHHLFTADELPGARRAKVGYIYMPMFYRGEGQGTGSRTGTKGVTAEIDALLKEFAAQNVDVVVLDLSENTGGALQEAIDLPGLFLGSEGVVSQVKGRAGTVQTYSPDKIKLSWNGPLVVRTGRGSAGGAEMVAGAIQDARRGLIVGSLKTTGMGTVGSILAVPGPADNGKAGPPLGQMKIIKEKLYLPAGASIQVRGVAADVALPSLGDIRPQDESTRQYALRFDEVPAARFQKLEFGLTDDLIQTLNKRSAERRAKSPELVKLAEKIAAAQGTEELINLNLVQFMAEEKQKAEQTALPSVPGISAVKLDEGFKELLLVALDYTSRCSLAEGEKIYAQRKFADALQHYRRAVAADPAYPDACYKLAWALATCPEASQRDGKEAVKHAQQACELDGWKSWRFLLGLAVSEAEAGNFENALKHLKSALEAAPAEQRTAFSYLQQRFEKKQTFAQR